MMSLHPPAKLSRILAVYSKIEVSDGEFTPLSKAGPVQLCSDQDS